MSRGDNAWRLGVPTRVLIRFAELSSGDGELPLISELPLLGSSGFVGACQGCFSLRLFVNRLRLAAPLCEFCG